MRRLLPLFALALAACGPEPKPLNGVLHLEPCLEDGRSSAAVLSQSRSERARWPGEAEGAWVRADSGAPVQGQTEKAWRSLRPTTGERPPALEHRAPLDADRVNLIEFDLLLAEDARAQLAWRPRGVAEWDASRVVARELVGSAEPQTVRFALGAVPHWRGHLEALRFEPSSDRVQEVRVLGARFLEQGFAPGFASEGSDGGLVSLSGTARRAFPADLGTPLVAALTVPADGRLMVHLASTPAAGAGPISYSVGVRGAEDERELLAGRLEDGPSASSRWARLAADLSPWAGRAVELVFRAERAGAGGRAPDLERAAVLWGSPLVSGSPPEDRRPNLVLVTLDTWRADHLGFDGGEARTPFLDRLAAEGVAFEEALTTHNSTQPSHASILTGTYANDHGVHDNFSVLGAGEVLLSEVLRAGGYQTLAAVSQPCLSVDAGFGQGFDTFLLPAPDAHLNGASTVARTLDWLAEWEAFGEPPFFLWLHLYDPHTPYGPPPDFLQPYLAATGESVPPTAGTSMPRVDVLPPDMQNLVGVTNLDYVRFLYRGGVSYADHLVSRVGAALEEAGSFEDTAFLVTADHGESLGERDSWFNHRGLFDEVVRVPLILKLPAGLAGSPSAGAPASTLDAARTLLAAAGLEAPAGMGGIDLARPDPEESGRRLWFEHASRHQTGFREGDAWFVTTRSERMIFGLEVRVDAEGRHLPEVPPVPRGTSYLFDLAQDPQLQRNLAADRRQAVERYQAEVEAWHAEGGGRSERREMTDSQLTELGNLGYTEQLESNR